MGLDQYASNFLSDGDQPNQQHISESHFTWRKHSKLHQFMTDIWVANGGDADEFNCQPLKLTKENIIDLQRRIKLGILPQSNGGFFFGHQWQDEASQEYREQDLEFCEWALDQFDQGLPVYYDCWW